MALTAYGCQRGREKMGGGNADTARSQPSAGRRERQRRYAPQLRPELLHRLYLLSEQEGRPMTELLNEALEQFLFSLEGQGEREWSM